MIKERFKQLSRYEQAILILLSPIIVPMLVFIKLMGWLVDRLYFLFTGERYD